MELTVFGSIALAIAALFGIFVLFLAYDVLRFVRRAVRSEGKVVGFESEEDNDFSVSYYVRVSFEDTKGIKRVVTIRNIAISSHEYEVGASVPILFDPTIPEDTRIDSFPGIWLPLVLTSIATVFCVAISVWASLT